MQIIIRKILSSLKIYLIFIGIMTNLIVMPKIINGKASISIDKSVVYISNNPVDTKEKHKD